MDISQVCTLLRQLGLETSIDEEGPGPGIPPSFMASSENSTISLNGTEDGMISLSYFAFEEEEARYVLKDCPEIIRHWYDQLDNLIEVDEFKQAPLYQGTFTPNQALEICFYLGSRMMGQTAQTQHDL